MSSIVGYKRGRTSSRGSGRSRMVSRSSSSRKRNFIGPRRGYIINQGNQWSKGGSLTAYLRAFDPFPSKMRCRLRYSQGKTLSTAGSVATTLFRANGIFDPDFSGIGHQPYGHDTYESIYQKYIVVNSYISVSVLSNTNQGAIGVSVTDDNTVQGNYNTIKETKGTKWIPITYTGAPTVTNRFSLSMLDEAQQSNCQSTFGSSPNQQMFYHVWYCAKNEGTDTAIDVNVCITYDVEVCELKDLGQS